MTTTFESLIVGTADETKVELFARGAAPACVVFRALLDGGVTALDLMPKGTPIPSETDLVTWIDLVDMDLHDGGTGHLANSARLGNEANRVVVGGVRHNGATPKPVHLIFGGATRAILGTNPTFKIPAVYTGSQRSLQVVSATDQEQLAVRGTGETMVPGSYASTTTNAPNVYMASDGKLQRSTSAQKYKKDVKPITKERLAKFKQLKGVTFRSACEGDDQRRLHSGVIADQAQELGLTDLVIYGKGGEVEGFAYERCVAYFLAWEQETEARLTALETKEAGERR